MPAPVISHRAMHPVSPEETTLFQAVLFAGFMIRGFTNRSLRETLEPDPGGDEHQRRQASGTMTRKLRLLSAHGLIRKTTDEH